MSCKRVRNKTVCRGINNRLLGQDGLAMGGGGASPVTPPEVINNTSVANHPQRILYSNVAHALMDWGNYLTWGDCIWAGGKTYKIGNFPFDIATYQNPSFILSFDPVYGGDQPKLVEPAWTNDYHAAVRLMHDPDDPSKLYTVREQGHITRYYLSELINGDINGVKKQVKLIRDQAGADKFAYPGFVAIPGTNKFWCFSRYGGGSYPQGVVYSTDGDVLDDWTKIQVTDNPGGNTNNRHYTWHLASPFDDSGAYHVIVTQRIEDNPTDIYYRSVFHIKCPDPINAPNVWTNQSGSFSRNVTGGSGPITTAELEANCAIEVGANDTTQFGRVSGDVAPDGTVVVTMKDPTDGYKHKMWTVATDGTVTKASDFVTNFDYLGTQYYVEEEVDPTTERNFNPAKYVYHFGNRIEVWTNYRGNNPPTSGLGRGFLNWSDDGGATWNLDTVNEIRSAVWQMPNNYKEIPDGETFAFFLANSVITKYGNSVNVIAALPAVKNGSISYPATTVTAQDNITWDFDLADISFNGTDQSQALTGSEAWERMAMVFSLTPGSTGKEVIAAWYESGTQYAELYTQSGFLYYRFKDSSLTDVSGSGAEAYVRAAIPAGKFLGAVVIDDNTVDLWVNGELQDSVENVTYVIGSLPATTPNESGTGDIMDVETFRTYCKFANNLTVSEAALAKNGSNFGEYSADFMKIKGEVINRHQMYEVMQLIANTESITIDNNGSTDFYFK